MEPIQTSPVTEITPPAATPAAPVVAPAATTPPATTPTTFEPGGNVTEGDWLKSINWLETGLIFVGLLALYSVIYYHRLKIINLKTEIPKFKKKLDDIENQVNFLDDSKQDKRPARPMANNRMGINFSGLR